VSASAAADTLLLYDRLFAVTKTMNSTAVEAVRGTFTRYQSAVATQGTSLTETTTMPETNYTITQGTMTITEYGNSVPYTAKLDDLSLHPVKEVIAKVQEERRQEGLRYRRLQPVQRYAVHRPALVLSSRAYNRKTGPCLACPFTSRIKGYPFELRLPAACAVQGAVLVDHVKNQDWQARRAERADTVSGDFADQVADLVDALMRVA